MLLQASSRPLHPLAAAAVALRAPVTAVKSGGYQDVVVVVVVVIVVIVVVVIIVVVVVAAVAVRAPAAAVRARVGAQYGDTLGTAPGARARGLPV